MSREASETAGGGGAAGFTEEGGCVSGDFCIWWAAAARSRCSFSSCSLDIFFSRFQSASVIFELLRISSEGSAGGAGRISGWRDS
jgi:hypothetical protein